MSFDHPYTCPQIDEGIDDIQTNMRDVLEGFVQEVAPFSKGDLIDTLLDEQAKELYHTVDGLVEGIRTSNENMRSAAEDQCNDRDEKIDEREADIKELEDDKQELSEKVDSLEQRIQELEDENVELRHEIIVETSGIRG